MTREEAKELLLNISAYDIDMQRGMAKQEALDMAIKALEQTELKTSYNSIKTELNNDTISRQAAMGIIQNWLDFDTGYSWGEKNVMKCTIDELRDLPSVSSENSNRSEIEQKCDRINSLASVLPYAPHREIQELLCEIMDMSSVSTEKTGRWIEKEDWNGDTYYDCSECGESFCFIDGIPTDNLYNYCPNCGCRMMEVEE